MQISHEATLLSGRIASSMNSNVLVCFKNQFLTAIYKIQMVYYITFYLLIMLRAYKNLLIIQLKANKIFILINYTCNKLSPCAYVKYLYQTRIQIICFI